MLETTEGFWFRKVTTSNHTPRDAYISIASGYGNQRFALVSTSFLGDLFSVLFPHLVTDEDNRVLCSLLYALFCLRLAPSCAIEASHTSALSTFAYSSASYRYGVSVVTSDTICMPKVTCRLSSASYNDTVRMEKI